MNKLVKKYKNSSGAATQVKCDPDYDVVFIPFSPISQTDRFEVRIQLKTKTGTLPVNVDVFLDTAQSETKVLSKRITVGSDKFQLIKCFPDVRNQKCGTHEVLIRFTAEDGTAGEVRKVFELRKAVPNLLEGAFISFGASKNHTQCFSFADAKMLTDAQWKKEMDALAEIGFKLIIPQGVIQLNDILSRGMPEKKGVFSAYYPSRYYPKADIAAHDPIRAVLEEAEHNGQIVFLPYCSIYRNIVHRYDVMRELFERYGRYKSFYGWYEPLELALTGDSKVGVFPVFAEICRILEEDRVIVDELGPAKPILLSVSCSACNGLNETICQTLTEGRVKADIIMTMDCVGSCSGRPEQLMYNSRIFSVLKAVFASTDTHVWGNCEAFDLASGNRLLVPRFRNGGFDGTAGFVQQMETVQPYVEKILTFQATGEFVKPGSPSAELKLGGKEGIKQYCLYKNYLQSPRPVYRNIALKRPYAKSRKPDLPVTKKKVDSEQQYLSTDDYLAGGMENDVARMHGYFTKEDFIEVTVDFDLQAKEKIDRVRVANSPVYDPPYLPLYTEPRPGWETDSVKYSPDKIAVSLGTDQNELCLVAVLREYKDGWAEVKFPQGIPARFVRFVFSKQKRPDEKEMKMFINEIEIGQIV